MGGNTSRHISFAGPGTRQPCSTPDRRPMTSLAQSSTQNGDPTARLGRVHHLRASGVSLVLDCRGPRLPRIVHWGADLGELSSQLLDNLAAGDVRGVVSNVPDEPVTPAVLTEHATGWSGIPGLTGSRGGQAWSTLFTVTGATSGTTEVGTQRIECTSRDGHAGLALTLVIELTRHGLLRAQAELADLTSDRSLTETPYTVEGLI